jgi:uncharacterized protein YqeY
MIIDILKAENLTARKIKDKFTSGILTCLIGEIEIVGKNDGNRKTNDSEAIKVITKFKKGAEEILKAKPSDEVKNEIKIYDTYLPKLMTEDELAKLISDMIDAWTNPNIGMIMSQLKKSGYNYDGKMASSIIRTSLK